ncbi:hypothetical protein CS542_07655 [Pedobacter sp. IW39]|nr:hypothetical protein CS542_07655 [Pedobacter sp. IW39]
MAIKNTSYSFIKNKEAVNYIPDPFQRKRFLCVTSHILKIKFKIAFLISIPAFSLSDCLVIFEIKTIYKG